MQSKQTGHKPAARWHRIRVIAGLLIVCSGWGWMIGSAYMDKRKSPARLPSSRRAATMLYCLASHGPHYYFY
jgi:hypothetical protein